MKLLNCFKAFLKNEKSRIRNFEGCAHLELWQDTVHSNIFFTYSHWADESALLHYRNSTFFRETWQKTKEMFEEKAQAWSVKQAVIMS